MASLKHTHEKVGDHWEPKDQKGPSDRQAARSGRPARDRPVDTAEGVNAFAPKKHLVEVAKEVGVKGAQRMTKPQLVDAIQKANSRATAQPRRECACRDCRYRRSSPAATGAVAGAAWRPATTTSAAAADRPTDSEPDGVHCRPTGRLTR